MAATLRKDILKLCYLKTRWIEESQNVSSQDVETMAANTNSVT